MTADPAVLRKAADIIRDGGLSKGLYWTAEGSHCTIGALCEAKGVTSSAGIPLTWKAPEEMALVAEVAGVPVNAIDAFVWPGHEYERGIAAWNDHPATTAADVIAVFETAAEKLEANL